MRCRTRDALHPVRAVFEQAGQPVRVRTATYAERPFMGPALEAEKDSPVLKSRRASAKNGAKRSGG